jgi:hypothetical protein
VTFPLQILAPAIEERAKTWASLDICWRVFPIEPNHDKPAARVELESAAWLGQIMLWNSGEAELDTIRLTDDRIVNKHYDLTSRDDLNVLLDELVRLLVRDEVPDRAIVLHAPAHPVRHADTAPRRSSDGDAPTAR